LSLSFFLMWIVPPVSVWWRVAYYTPITIMFHVAYTVVSVPYTAMVHACSSSSTSRNPTHSILTRYSHDRRRESMMPHLFGIEPYTDS